MMLEYKAINISEFFRHIGSHRTHSFSYTNDKNYVFYMNYVSKKYLIRYSFSVLNIVSVYFFLKLLHVGHVNRTICLQFAL